MKKKVIFIGIIFSTFASAESNCIVKETGNILGANFTISLCKQPIVCEQNDTKCQASTNCIPHSDGYLCIERQ